MADRGEHGVSASQDAPTLSIRLHVTPTAYAASAARADVADALVRWHGLSDEMRHNVLVVLNELMTNAVQYAGTGAWLHIDRHRGYVDVSVLDDALAIPRPRSAGPDDESGRGLSIVAALADDWGVEQRANGKRVWARFSLAGSSGAVQ